ncbi:hypothetical protein [Acetobacterium woodii]|uniref:hypothetical protein n=1 Tax=Acetobacterium woodii TaxID=33952 RepID=UPI0003134A26|nr:hypothetical protein [Acetobacterium woodii]
MEKADITKTIVELTVDKVLIDMETDVERSIRNLVDLGQNFSKGRFQKLFFEVAQKMLEDEESPYYLHAKNIISKVNHETLKTFGINLGYNGCTNGAKQIRENEKKYQLKIPWTIAFSMPDAHKISEYAIEKIISQGEQLGTYVYLIFCTPNKIQQVVYLLKKFPDCAFVIFLEGAFTKIQVIKELYGYHNFMISILAEAKEFIKMTDFLTENGFLYAVHSFYNDTKLAEIITEKWIKSVLRTACSFAFLISENSCSLEVKNAVRNYVLGVREKQQYPIFLIEVTSDLRYINQIISADSESIGFNSDGQLYTSAGEIAGENNNLLNGNLLEILSRNMPINGSRESLLLV